MGVCRLFSFTFSKTELGGIGATLFSKEVVQDENSQSSEYFNNTRIMEFVLWVEAGCTSYGRFSTPISLIWYSVSPNDPKPPYQALLEIQELVSSAALFWINFTISLLKVPQIGQLYDIRILKANGRNVRLCECVW